MSKCIWCSPALTCYKCQAGDPPAVTTDVIIPKVCVWCRAPTERKVNFPVAPRQVGHRGDADTFPKYVFIPTCINECRIHLSYAVFSHTDWRYACGHYCMAQWLAEERFVAPPPPTKEEEEAFAKEAEAAEAKWEGGQA